MSGSPSGLVEPGPSNGIAAPSLTVRLVNPMTAVGGMVDAELLGELRGVAARVGGRRRHELGPAGRGREREREAGVARRVGRDRRRAEDVPALAVARGVDRRQRVEVERERRARPCCSSVPVTVVVPPALVTAVMTGKFW